MSYQAFFERLGLMLLFFAVTGVTWAYKSFTHFQILGLYSLEWIWLGWLAAALAAAFSGEGVREFFRGLLTFRLFQVAALFASWGVVLLIYDLFSTRFEVFPVVRVLQHALIVVYPALWITAGYWFWKASRKAVFLAGITVLVLNTLKALISLGDINMSVGLLGALALVSVFDQVLRKPSLKLIASSLLLSIAVGFPICRMFYNEELVQRVSLLMVFLMLGLGPVVLCARRELLRGIFEGLALSGALATGISLCTLYSQKPLFGHTLSDKLASSLKHGEDYDYVPFSQQQIEGKPLKFKDRSFWWAQAIRDWKAAPVTGIGFGPEVPSWIRPETKNDGVFLRADDLVENFSGKPISGPHNSYLTILVRTGLVGLGLFSILLGTLGLSAWRFIRCPKVEPSLFGLILVFIPFNGFVHAFVQIGLEAPHNCMLLWLFAGALARAATVRATTKLNE